MLLNVARILLSLLCVGLSFGLLLLVSSLNSLAVLSRLLKLAHAWSLLQTEVIRLIDRIQIESHCFSFFLSFVETRKRKPLEDHNLTSPN